MLAFHGSVRRWNSSGCGCRSSPSPGGSSAAAAACNCPIAPGAWLDSQTVSSAPVLLSVRPDPLTWFWTDCYRMGQQRPTYR
jgi:hypothetical protein